MDQRAALDAFSSIANETRLRILKSLVVSGQAGLPAGDIAASVGATPSRTSFHLANMVAAGLIQSRRRSRQIVYAVDFEAIGALVRFLLEDCCRNDPTVRACCDLDQTRAMELKTPAGSGGC